MSEQVKIDCKTCEGKRVIELEQGMRFKDCPSCRGTGRDVYAERDALQAEYNELESHLIKVQETGAEAYIFAIEGLEDFMRERAEAGKSAVMIKSLTEGLHWVYEELGRVEAECERLREELAEIKAQPSQMLLEALVNQLERSGAENYIESSFSFKIEGSDVLGVVTLQRKDKPTAHQLRIKAEAELAAIKEQLTTKKVEDVKKAPKRPDGITVVKDGFVYRY